ncbi:S41 family peptidase [Candidatus Saccharibacteria bacterium]|nr:S41 family peptidase [Candidatus Saccharibacteria bacterium]
MNKSKERKVSLSSAIIGGVVTLALGILIGANWHYLAGFLPYFGINTTSNEDWSALNEVYSALDNNYDGELDKNQLLDGAKKGLVSAVGDEYTTYMSAEEAQEFKKTLEGDVGSGIGVEIATRDGYVRVIRTLPDNPAREAGMLAGDIFYKINGEEIYDLSSEDIANKIRGEEGTEVTVTVVRDGEEKTFTMKREKINNVSAYVTYDGNTAILKILRFDNNTGALVQKLAKEIKDKGSNKIILDLRGNGGGYVTAAQEVLSLWLDGDAIVTQKSIHFEDATTYASRGKAILKDIKTIVLVDGTTASASEITAGALQDYGKATLVGEQTYGKGVVQTLLDLSGGSILKVTTAHWYTPHDNNIDGDGIKPDIEVKNTYDDTNHGRDPQLDKAKSL